MRDTNTGTTKTLVLQTTLTTGPQVLDCNAGGATRRKMWNAGQLRRRQWNQ